MDCQSVAGLRVPRQGWASAPAELLESNAPMTVGRIDGHLHSEQLTDRREPQAASADPLEDRTQRESVLRV